MDRKRIRATNKVNLYTQQKRRRMELGAIHVIPAQMDACKVKKVAGFCRNQPLSFNYREYKKNINKYHFIVPVNISSFIFEGKEVGRISYLPFHSKK
ncbi:hypothetical protein LIS82_26970 (plasmid) [Cytobacillus solani]|uniref:hypothetical protein n=1 Tax=Cytobacillus solani TaxID=1637975 RepID=UPI00207A00C5|nr:hypothetical protein [Cytobacillus solani]USK57859.1 hypothetical protein LIS82_26970 [Cytobacillus solani]